MYWKDREEIQVIEALKEAECHYQNLVMDEFEAEDEGTPAWEERVESRERTMRALETAVDFISDKYHGRKKDAVLVHENIAPSDSASYAEEISRMKKNSRLDIRCPVCGRLTRAVDMQNLRRTIFCWNCGQPMTAYVGKMYDVLLRRSGTRKGGGMDATE